MFLALFENDVAVGELHLDAERRDLGDLGVAELRKHLAAA